VRPIYFSNAEDATRLDAVLLRSALVVAVALALALAIVALNNPVVLLTFVVAASLAFAVWSYRTNELARDVQASLDDVWDVVVEALGENGFLFGEPTWDGATEGRVVADDALVVAERHPGGFTRVRVTVGLFRTSDNRRRAALILESVAKHVADRARAATN
jgi:hypothetical protein